MDQFEAFGENVGMRKRGAVVATLAAMIMVGSASPSSAASSGRADARGDAPTRIDVVHFRIINGIEDLEFVVRVADLEARGPYGGAISFSNAWSWHFFQVNARRSPTGQERATLHEVDAFGQWEDRIACPIYTSWDDRRDVISVTVKRPRFDAAPV